MENLCHYCKQETDKKRDFSISYDVRGSHGGGGQFEKPCCDECWKQHWKESTKFWDDTDEVMNRNTHFIREKGMIGKYKDGEHEYGPVYGYWKRANIEGYFLFDPLGEEKKHLYAFRQWLLDNRLTYKYESR